LIEIEQPKQENYILIESMPLDKNTSRMIHALGVTENKETFKLGRGHESEVRVNDISVSRCHAIIKYKPDGFYIEDNISKFGTIVLVKEKLPLEQDCTKAVQIGRTVVSFTVRKLDYEKIKKQKELSEQQLIKPKVDELQKSMEGKISDLQAQIKPNPANSIAQTQDNFSGGCKDVEMEEEK